MAPAPVLIDTSDDFVPAVKSVSKRNLVLAPPSVAAHEEQLHDVFATLDRSTSDIQMLDRLSIGVVSLPSETYDNVLVLTGINGGQRQEALGLLGRKLYGALVPAMKSGAKFNLQDGPLTGSEAREAILAGLVEKDGAFVKIEEEEVVVPLRFGAKRKVATNGATNGAVQPIQPVQSVQINLDDDLNSDDELIEEEDLLTAEDLKRPIVQPDDCKPKPGKRRRPCKDCTCGLADKMNAEDEARKNEATQKLNALKFDAEELYDELDFTVQGKTGSCSSCSLGDAFRCVSCPYVGLPPFKPGEEVKILNNAVQL